MNKIRLFCFLVFLGAGASFLSPNFSVAQSQVEITATVLEHLTIIESNGKYEITTNLRGGYWAISENQKLIVVAKY